MRVGQEGFLGGASRQGSARRKEWQEATSPWGGHVGQVTSVHSLLVNRGGQMGPPDLPPPLQAAPALQGPLIQGHTCCPGLSPVLRRVLSLSAPSPGCIQSALNACRDELCD